MKWGIHFVLNIKFSYFELLLLNQLQSFQTKQLFQFQFQLQLPSEKENQLFRMLSFAV